MNNDQTSESTLEGTSFGFHNHTREIEEIYTGLCAQDLQEAKDQLVVETADMLVRENIE